VNHADNERHRVSLRPPIEAGEWFLVRQETNMTNLNNEICELNVNELDGVSGGTWMDTVTCVVAAVNAINGIESILGKAVDGIPPAPCHPKG
jgi:hypothetical protein